MVDEVISPASSQVERDTSSVFIKRHTVLLLSLLLIISLLVTGILVYAYVLKAGTTKSVQTLQLGNATISGELDINGPLPSSGTVTVMARVVGTEDFSAVAEGVPAVDGGSWHWTSAKQGEPYEIQGILNANGQTITKSNILTVAAPADEEQLLFTISSPSTQGAAQSNVNISGSINLNGYIPQGASIAIATQQIGSSSFTTVASGVSASDGVGWSWNDAISGQVYSVQAYIMVGGVVVSSSPSYTIAAPATNELLTINSTVAPPTPATVSVTGSINLNGYIPSGSSITIAAAPSSTGTYTTFATNVPAVDGATWSFSPASSGQSYTFQAYLVNNGQNISQSQSLSVAAPATGEVLTINAQNQPSAPPSNSMTNTCVGVNSSTNLWQAQISYNTNNSVPGVQQYLLIVGTNQGGSQLVNNTSAPTNQNSANQTQSYTTGFLFTSGQTYYAQWAYSTCSNCNTFSQFSQPMQFYCTTPQPTNTPTLTPTLTNTPTPSSTPTPTQIGTPTPTMLAPINIH